jgi:hypothetical protein
MYHPTHIARLSPTQISKLLNGHRVRIKSGNSHVLHLSHEQHKKVLNAHKKGAAVTIGFDPFQQQMEHHHKLRHGHHHGHGGDTQLHESSSYHAHKGRGRGRKASHRGRGPFDIFKSVVKAVAPIAIEKGGDFLKNKIEGWGEGMRHPIKKRGRPRKSPVGCGRTRKHNKKGGNIGDDILHFAQEAAPYALPLMMGLGEGSQSHSHRRHSHRHHHGESLMPAGY